MAKRQITTSSKKSKVLTEDVKKENEQSSFTKMVEKLKRKSKDKEDIVILSPKILLSVWLDGWKKTFTLKGRTSKFELWIFLLINTVLCATIQIASCYVLSEMFLRHAQISHMDITSIENSIVTARFAFYIAMLGSVLPVISMSVRRMHDLGELAWSRYLEPIFMGVVVLSVIQLTVSMLMDEDEYYISVLLLTCFITIFYSVGFYSIKFLIKSLFYQGETKKNVYGEAHYNTPTHDSIALNFCCLWFLFVLTQACLYMILALV